MQRFMPVPLTAAAFAILVLGCDASRSVEPEADLGTPSAARSTGSELSAPSELSAVLVSNSQVNIRWADNSTNESGFEVHRTNVIDSSTYSLVAALDANATGYDEPGLGAPYKYCYRVRAVRTTGKKSAYSNFSNISCASTVAPEQPVPPAAPSHVTAVVSAETQIRINWQDNSNDETGFNIRMFGFNPIAFTGPDVVTANTNFPPTPGTQYCFQLQAFRNTASGTLYSALSDTACAMIPVPTEPPAGSYVITASPYSYYTSGIAITLVWPGTSVQPEFKVYRSTDGGASWTEIVGFESLGYNRILVGAELERSTCYYVVPFNLAGEGLRSNTACATMPRAPTNLVATPIGTDSLELTWDDNSGVETGYQLVGSYWQGNTSDAGVVCWDSPVLTLPANTTRVRVARFVPPDYSGALFYMVATKDGGTSAGSNAVSLNYDP